MRVLFSLVFLFSFLGVSVFAQNVHFFVDREEVVDIKSEDAVPKHISLSGFNFPTNDVLPGDRRIIFKIRNESDRSIVIYGVEYGTTFQPSGFLIDLDMSSGKRNDPTSEREARELKLLSQADKRVLEQGESLEFSSLLSSTADKGKRFKRIAYYSSSRDNCRHLIATEFSLSK